MSLAIFDTRKYEYLNEIDMIERDKNFQALLSVSQPRKALIYLVKIETVSGTQTTGFATEFQAQRASTYALAHGAKSAIIMESGVVA